MNKARVTTLASSLAVAALATGVAASSSTTTRGVAFLRFYERPGQTTTVDKVPRGKMGDVFLYSNPIFDRQGTRVGTDHGVCTMLNARQSQCNATLTLPKGQIVTLGLHGPEPEAKYEAAVIGGTGAYAAARGTLVTRALKDGGWTIMISLV
jgi:Allene oxide cyclase barrel like domain